MPNQEQEQDNYPSKTQRKKAMTDLQVIGKQLCQLKPRQLLKFSLPVALDNAIAEYQRLPNSNEAKRRQLQYIGKVMRKVDSESIKQLLTEFNQQAQNNSQRLHKLEEWRERLITQGDQALGLLIDEYPTIDRQVIRQLIRQAKKEAGSEKAQFASRKLFRYLQKIIK